jgi:hypothetical protein
MNARAAGLAVGLALIAAAPAASPASAPVAHSSCTYARIDGQSKCIARGQFCKRSAQRDYRRYGFSCSKLDRNGRYHLT